MSRLLYRLGHGSAAHPWRTIAAWVARRPGLSASRPPSAARRRTTGTSPAPVPRPASTSCASTSPSAGGATAQVVVHDRDGGAPRPPTSRRSPSGSPTCRTSLAVGAPRLSERRRHRAARRPVRRPGHRPRPDGQPRPARGRRRTPPATPGCQVELGGEVPETAAAPIEGHGELIGIVAALLILVLAFGSVVAAGLPIAVALVGLGVGSARHHAARRGHGRQHHRPDRRHDGRPRRRHRLRAAAGHPARRVPARRGHDARGRRRGPSPPRAARSSSPASPCWSR